MPKKQILHVIEPALLEPVGHLFSFFENLCNAAKDVEIHLYADNRFTYETTKKNVHVHPYFIRKIRKWQAQFLFRKLARTDGKIFYPTAETTDLIAARYFAGKKLEPNTVFMFFHLINIKKRKHNLRNRKKRKENFFSGVALAQPELVLFAPTKTPTDFLRECGFQHVHLAPYPLNPEDYRPHTSEIFSHLLLSGDPRIDKGINEIAEYVSYCVRNNQDVPLHLQSRSTLINYPEDLREALEKIFKSGYQHINTFPSAMKYQDYRNLYSGAISMQLYDQTTFADRASGVALDALLHGAPSIVLRGTWNANLIERFNAGVVLENTSPETIQQAVEKTINKYRMYSDNAAAAGEVLCKEHSMDNIIKLIFP